MSSTNRGAAQADRPEILGWKAVDKRTYDIVVDRRRARVARRLQREGDRIQKSVFIARLTPARFDALVDDLADLIDARIDLVDFIPLCAACRNRARRLGPGVLDAPRWMVF